MAEVVQGIFSLDIEHQKVIAGLNEVNAKYRQTTEVADAQERALNDLVVREKELVAARAKSNNPTTIVNYNNELKKVKAQQQAIKSTLKDLTSEQKAYEKELQKTASELNKAFDATRINGAKNALKGLKNESSGIGGMLSSAIGAAAVLKLGNDVIKTTAQFEKFSAVLTNTLGSSSLAQKALQQIKEFAARTPFSVEELTGSFVKLANQGFVPTMDELRKMGDLASSVGKPFDQLTEAVLDAQTGEFERLKEFGIKARIQGDKIAISFKGQTEKIQNTSEAIRNYIVGLGEAEGVSGSMAAISETLGGKLSNLGDQWDAFLNKLGQDTGGIASGAIKTLEILLEGLSGIVDGINGIATAGRSLQLKDLGILGVREDLAKKLVDAGVRPTIGDPGDKGMIQTINALTASQKGLDENFEKSTKTAEVYAKSKESIQRLLDGEKKRHDEGKTSIQEYTAALFFAEDMLNTLNLSYAKANEVKSQHKVLTKQEEEAIKKANAERKKELESLEALRKQLRDARNDFTEIQNAATLKDAELINANFDLQVKRSNEALDDQRKKLSEQFKNKERYNEAVALLDEINLQITKNIESKRTEELKKFNQERLKINIEGQKEISDAQIEINKLNQATDEELFSQKLLAAQIYWDAVIQLAKDSSASELEIAKLKIAAELELLQLQISEANRIKEENSALESEAQRHELAMLDIADAGEKKILEKKIQFAKERLNKLVEEGKVQGVEWEKAFNEVEELEAESNKRRKEENQALVQAYLDGIKQVLDATIDGIDKILQAQISALDKQIGIQEKRVQDAQNLADEGNAKLLELEKKRLSDLQKEREKFVRAQQALAVIELIANTAVAVSKAAAQGGVAAPFTVAAALIALVAGLAQARQIASQAAFYTGGEYTGGRAASGYTGDGNPTAVSKAVGQKPYIYHKREFIFNHEKTDRFGDIFRKIHSGTVDLKDWESKVKKYDSMLAFNPFNLSRPVVMVQAPSSDSGRLDEVEGTLHEILSAIKGQPGTHLNFDGKGFSAYLKSLKSRSDLIDQLAR